MKRRRRERLRWSAALLLATAFSLLGAAALVFTRSFPARMPTVRDPHARPLDFADAELRHALDEYAMFTGHHLPHIVDRCSGQREIYRSMRNPGLGDGVFEAVDVEVSGSTALVKRWAFVVRSPQDGTAWQVVSRRTVDSDVIASIRSDAARLLLSDLAPAIGDAYVDATERIVETCRNGRYHFYRRRDFQPVPDTPFHLFARNLLALSRYRSTGQ